MSSSGYQLNSGNHARDNVWRILTCMTRSPYSIVDRVRVNVSSDDKGGDWNAINFPRKKLIELKGCLKMGTTVTLSPMMNQSEKKLLRRIKSTITLDVCLAIRDQEALQHAWVYFEIQGLFYMTLDNKVHSDFIKIYFVLFCFFRFPQNYDFQE